MTERGKRKRRAKLRSREGGCDENMTIHDIHRRGPCRRTGSSLAMLPLVMPGLVPGISIGAMAAAEMDARNKSGHDGGGRSGMTEGAHPGLTEEPVPSLSKEGVQAGRKGDGRQAMTGTPPHDTS